MNLSLVHKTLISVWIRVIAAAVLIFSIGTIFFVSLSIIKQSDTDPALNLVTEARASKFGPFVTRVHAGLFITNFSRFDPLRGQFYFDAIVWFEYDPREVTMDIIKKFSFVNGRIMSMSSPDIKFIGRSAFVTFRVSVRMSAPLRFDNFPYDGHRLTISLTNNSVTPGEIVYTTSPTSYMMGDYVDVDDWAIDSSSFTARAGYSKATLNSDDPEKKTANPVVQFTFAFKMLGKKNIFVIFVPLLFAVIVGMFSFLIPFRYKGDNALIWGLAATTITSILGYRFVLQTIMPSVGYMTTTDYVYGVALVVAFVPFLFQILLSLFLRKNIESDTEGIIIEDRLNVINIILFMLLSLGIVISLYFIIL